ncbi:kallikrein 1-related peptidase b22-like [Gordionus sp. m RMFG-2023]|uniref:kallikrein 1-related peptidase b22-like n=1 Tax=Gordionus sp. m RMFG-2023 TaxID=3053472 RepID=UPI0031FD518A
MKNNPDAKTNADSHEISRKSNFANFFVELQTKSKALCCDRGKRSVDYSLFLCAFMGFLILLGVTVLVLIKQRQRIHLNQRNAKFMDESSNVEDKKRFCQLTQFKNCGIPYYVPIVTSCEERSRIIGGDKAESHSWPWQAAIFEGNRMICGGSLINEKWVLTAAHCFKGYNKKKFSPNDLTSIPHYYLILYLLEPNCIKPFFNIPTGYLTLFKPNPPKRIVLEKLVPPKNQTRPMSAIIIKLGIDVIFGSDNEEEGEELKPILIVKYSAFSFKSLDGDIALIKLNREVHFSEKILPICLPTNKDENMNTYSDECYVTGWGTVNPLIENPTNHLMQLCVPFNKPKDCNNLYKNLGRITENMFCAGYVNSGKDACKGDSGGPFVCQPKNLSRKWIYKISDEQTEFKWLLVGITSWGIGCALSDHPGVYTKMSKFICWLIDTINIYKDNTNATGVVFL